MVYRLRNSIYIYIYISVKFLVWPFFTPYISPLDNHPIYPAFKVFKAIAHAGVGFQPYARKSPDMLGLVNDGFQMSNARALKQYSPP